MSRLSVRAWLAVALLPATATLAHAAAAHDHGWGWPLELSDAAAGAHRVELTADIYSAAWSPTLADVVVVNGDGQPVPTALLPAVGAAPVQRALPWFPLPAGAAARDIASISEIGADGRLRRLELRASGPGAAALLVDASQVDGALHALTLAWAAGQPPFEQAFDVEGSDDLRDWKVLQADARVFELQRDGARLSRGRIAFEAPLRVRYLRLRPRQTAVTLALEQVVAEVVPPAPASAWLWRVLEPRTARVDGREAYEYRLDGRFPVSRVDLDLTGDASQRWTLSARDDDDAAWRPLAADWVVYRLGRDPADRSPPLRLDASLRASGWRLQPAAPVAAPPRLRLGYRPETLVFIAEGAGPFTLLAGSARATRPPATLAPVLDALRRRHGAGWQPAVARPGTRVELAGTDALEPVPVRDWTTWTLWGVLLAGVALVAGFAISLLRRAAPPAG